MAESAPYVAFWLVVGAIVVTAILKFGEEKPIPVEALKANAEACASLGKEPFVDLMSHRRTIGCKQEK